MLVKEKFKIVLENYEVKYIIEQLSKERDNLIKQEESTDIVNDILIKLINEINRKTPYKNLEER